MQAKKRYILVFVTCAFLAYCYFGGYRLKSVAPQPKFSNFAELKISPHHLPSYLSSENEAHHDPDELDELSEVAVAAHRQEQLAAEAARKYKAARTCRMDSCFDFTKCYEQFLVYVYPPEPVNSLGSAPPISPNYQKIVTAIRESRYYTPDPARACLFVLGIDTLDRDSLSEDYVRNVPSRLARLPHWNNGRNHLIFNLYSGTWPEYAENSLGFDTGEAILAKASMSVLHRRPGFDVSIPLFHKQFPLRAGATGLSLTNNFPANKKYLLAFKGKR